VKQLAVNESVADFVFKRPKTLVFFQSLPCHLNFAGHMHAPFLTESPRQPLLGQTP